MKTAPQAFDALFAAVLHAPGPERPLPSRARSRGVACRPQSRSPRDRRGDPPPVARQSGDRSRHRTHAPVRGSRDGVRLACGRGEEPPRGPAPLRSSSSSSATRAVPSTARSRSSSDGRRSSAIRALLRPDRAVRVLRIHGDLEEAIAQAREAVRLGQLRIVQPPPGGRADRPRGVRRGPRARPAER